MKCRHYEQYGSCKYGDKCNYAHGDDDLRSNGGNGGGNDRNGGGGGYKDMQQKQSPMPKPQGM